MAKKRGKVITQAEAAHRFQKITASHRFIIALALVSIIGFSGIVSQTLFNYDLSGYVEAALLIVIGTGLIAESRVKTLTLIKEEGLTPTNFTHLTTVIIGLIAVLTGVFSIPLLRIDSSGFLAVKGIIALIAIIIIIIQTWVVE